MTISEITELLEFLQTTIADDYRATDDPEDNQPGMQVTIATDGDRDSSGQFSEPWTYQTGDNSFAGNCYGYQYWGVGYLYRDSDCKEIAADMIEQCREQYQ